eukprot:CAMPEP_0206197032 /NCGR_PEP_ID=MMETSP0166-20121206/8793_1 /ASSEMBLY_ACC=CAM_ASM_000260 /TAXON_ID=95228 /ORGANISM="Vannella robusta, Strain DIVA3 518/3/11/1/6" /LENGTH=476 /DNA_ID=CAMNT_0053614603 /DNA_START=90 /DNA_END=1520 /DNA_ORIENTATION=+
MTSSPTKATTKPSEIVFFSGNPTIESIKGVFHLCKDADSRHELWDATIPETRSDLVCVLSIPRWMSPSEFCVWMKKFEGVERMRAIKPANPSFYMAVIKFRSQHHADHFYMSCNSQPFNSVEPERCYAVFVQDVRFIEPQDGALFDPGDLKELPSCPVCLERLDAEESGLITSVCNHEFHSNCLAQCNSESNCPVCRYTLQPSDCQNMCSDCDATDSLWICLLCGNIGCSRYRNEHAELHFQQTGHTYSLEIDTQRVWDYAGDGYVHRLIQNNADGKLVEIPDPNSASMTRCGKGKNPSTVDALVVEYNYLLTSQLESQRLYFEQREAEKEAYIQALEEKIKSVSAIVPSREAEEQMKKEKDKKVAQLNSRLNKMQSECQTLRKENAFLKDINNELERNQDAWKNRVNEIEESTRKQLAQKEQRLDDLEGQVRDLMLHLDSSKVIASEDKAGNLSDGSVVNVNVPNRSNRRRNKRR